MQAQTKSRKTVYQLISSYLILSLLLSALVACGVSPQQIASYSPEFQAAMKHVENLAGQHGITSDVLVEVDIVDDLEQQVAYISGVSNLDKYIALTTFLNDDGDYIFAEFQYDGAFSDISDGTALESPELWSERYFDIEGNAILSTELRPQVPWFMIRAVLWALAKAGIKYLSRQACKNFIEEHVSWIPGWARGPICRAIF